MLKDHKEGKAFMYNIFYYIGYFIIMLIGAGLAIALAKTKAAWIILGIGSAVQFFALMYSEDLAAWGIFVILLGGSIALILYRKSQMPKQDPQGYQPNGNFQGYQPDGNFQPVPPGHWRCQCGRCNPDYAMSCICGLNRPTNM